MGAPEEYFRKRRELERAYWRRPSLRWDLRDKWKLARGMREADFAEKASAGAEGLQ